MNVQFRNATKAPGGWLPLEAYDDKDMDTKAPTSWLTVYKKDPSRKNLDQLEAGEQQETPKRREKTEISAKALWKDVDGHCFWRDVKVQRYLLKSERYEGYWVSTKNKFRLPRIYILFDDEDPRKFAMRFKKAYDTRAMADSMLKYNFYVENMPTHQIPEIDNEAVNRVLGMV
jgi:dynein heavy chain